MKLSVIVPVFDERSTAVESIARLLSVSEVSEVVVVDDGSQDGTRELLRDLRAAKVRVLYHPHNRGKTAAIRTALPHCNGELVVVHDADLEYDPKNLPLLMEPFSDPTVAAVFGTRYPREERRTLWWRWLRHWLGKEADGARPGSFYDAINPLNYYGTVVVTELANLLYGLELSDEATCYKIVRRDLLLHFDVGHAGFEFCAALVSELALGGHRIVELPIEYAPRTRKQKKKIRLRDGLSAARVLLARRFGR